MTDEEKAWAFDELITALFSEGAPMNDGQVPMITKDIKREIRGICKNRRLGSYASSAGMMGEIPSRIKSSED